MGSQYSLEVCVANFQSAIEAQRGGADRVELCENIIEGGTTPSAGMIRLVRERLEIGLHVMIRPRGGDFLYSDDEFEIMKADIDTAKKLKADGVVFGMLLPDGRIDLERSIALAELARPLTVTFHRAFDMTRDAFEALNDVKQIGADYLLTSGLQNKAHEGGGLIAQLVQDAGDDLKIMAGSGVNEETIEPLIKQTGARHFHVSCRGRYDSKMVFRNEEIKMGGVDSLSEYGLDITDAERIKAVKKKLRLAVSM